MRTIEEDVHIHAGARAVYRRLAALESLGESMPELFRSADAGAGPPSVVAQPALGGSGVPLVITRGGGAALADARPRGGTAAAGDTPPIKSFRWDLQPEGAAEVHVTLAVDYRMPVGVTGPFLDLLIHRPRRRQALRNALWRLKGLVEERLAP